MWDQHTQILKPAFAFDELMYWQMLKKQGVTILNQIQSGKELQQNLA